ncbi:tRNA(Met) cytidine acetyltransferase [Vibrio aquaticus]|uniref:tRNA(Met) cytidine acetyltransferase TmcA n=1 Tax=Vibrio aquaticus TaxID=2496559 RepID=A0A432D1V9_9VIBR|nr:GNAT family N-acetyltransferase [Vibrio aquaticus]RTZ17912.1 tRNA(Met) cytidine acetyltransferase [Vibrio aquaticus]
MAVISQYFTQLLQAAQQANHRFGVVLAGEGDWQLHTVQQICQLVDENRIYLLGDELTLPASKQVKFNKGQQLLGQECKLLVCDFRSGFDINSFSAALGCVKGGGLVVVLAAAQCASDTLDKQWLDNCLAQLLVVKQGQALPALPLSEYQTEEGYIQQQAAIEKIVKVVEGHRKRPLVMTADRGRGKSSALGMAAAHLMQQRSMKILLTAPTLATVQPVFEHASRLLPGATQTKNTVEWRGSTLEFIAPDELLRSDSSSDLLLVDEASAIPIPLLKRMVERHHRAVFSTTIHGYEGCGRGFTLKFQTWLKQQRPGSVFYHLDQPIRWAKSDPLERWLFDSFLLNAELSPLSDKPRSCRLESIDKAMLLANSNLLRECFALLVNAHYQTSPNDLMLLLNDPQIRLFAWFEDEVCLGCILTVDEGHLSAELIEDIQLGKRRPRGHLVPVMLANQLGIHAAAEQSSLRIMRIAVHPHLQGQGVGQNMLAQLQQQTDHDFYSTSFGATSELLAFWRYCGFVPVKLGSQRDQASGTHSLVMVKTEQDWLAQAHVCYQLSLHYSVAQSFSQLEIELVRSLFEENDASVDKPSFIELIQAYAKGGASYDSVAPFLDLWWKRSPKLLALASDLFVRKVVQRRSWSECAEILDYPGRKQVEHAFRGQLDLLLSQLDS